MSKLLNGYIAAAAIGTTLVLLFYNPPLVAFAAGIVVLAVAAVARYLVNRYGPDD